ncbi:TetR/AcrR family transcriptional regulator [Kineosporia succinea]|uniref:AcrR family transcriptional regulator n=1 Tax=Kineosporia succinea TaxID=84632 RepID=A0ABT9PCW4_9ACTN|nr:TetR/AcrR family transcriptional regulator [Kineosporia succinea]MDP9830554.1 AcrR family transcriptional regulator [Kineosporia succinea]
MARPVGRRGETRERILAAALELFAENGVHGTSLQQIADRLGVAKASVYHQFPTKDAMVVAVVQPATDAVGALVDEAESIADRAGQLDVLLRGMVDLVVEQRTLAAVLHGDPGVEPVLRAFTDLPGRVQRLQDLLLGADPSPARRVALSVLGGGLMLSGVDPLLAGLPDDVLRRELLATARQLFH